MFIRSPSIAAILALCSAVGGSTLADTGEQIFQQKCAGCHGTDGQGMEDGYDKPLLGDESVADLALTIDQTMPEDEPELCVGADARLAAEYIYHAFYSLEARLKKGLVAPPRVELSRLTVEQHRNVIADLIGEFTPAPSQDTKEEAGLRAEYFQSRGMSKADDIKQSRVDRRIDFNFGAGSPHAEISADQFSIVWQGSLVARETGYYEFRIRTENGARLYINNDAPEARRRLRDDSSVAGQAALIDAWVSSGNIRERTTRLYLLGGRRYPLRLEFFKYKERSASIRLDWRPPRGVWAILDDAHLVTTASPRTFVAETPFPADDRSLGYERGTSISREWHAATNQAAVAAASEIVERLPLLANVQDDNPQRDELVKEFVTQLAGLSFRRSLTSEEGNLLRQKFFGTSDLESATRRAVLFILESPNFLYTNLPSNQDQHAVAARLAFTLWDSIPDKELRLAAEKGELVSDEQLTTQARRMLSDPRARAKVRGFFQHWLELGERDLAKDKSTFPEFTETVISDLRYSLETFVEQIVWSKKSDYRDLLLADYLVLNGRLLDLYEPNEDATPTTDRPQVTEFRQFAFPDRRQAGILTHPYLLSAFAYHNSTSPIHRGVFVTRNIVGRALKPPPEAVSFKNDEFSPDLTMREKITELTRNSACISCHSVINPLGFALENYDAIGRWRTLEDNARPVDTRSEYVTADGNSMEIKDARDIAEFAVTSKGAHNAFITQIFQHLVKQNVAAYGSDTLDRLHTSFADDEFNIQSLLVRVAVTVAAFEQCDKDSEAMP